MSGRILFISNLFPPHILGGYEILCGQVARKFADLGWNVDVLTTNHGLTSTDLEVGPWEQINVSRTLRLFLPFGAERKIDRKKRYRVTVENRERTKSFIHANRPDVVFIWSLLRATVGPARSCQELNIPTAFTFNDANIGSYAPAPWNRSHKAIPDRLFWSDATLKGLRIHPSTCISDSVRTDLVNAGVDAQASKTIYQGVPLEEFPLKDEIGSGHQPFRVFYAGQLHDYKGVEDAIEGVKLASQRGKFSFRLAGKGDEAFERRLGELADGNDITLLGRLTRPELIEEYREADVFIFPSRWREPFGLTHLEAMACGTPVISTSEGGPGEFLRDRENSLVVPVRNPEAIARGLQELREDHALRLKLALAGRKLVEDKLNLDRYVHDLERWLTSTVMAG